MGSLYQKKITKNEQKLAVFCWKSICFGDSLNLTQSAQNGPIFAHFGKIFWYSKKSVFRILKQARSPNSRETGWVILDLEFNSVARLTFDFWAYRWSNRQISIV